MYVITVELNVLPEHSQEFKTLIERQAKASVDIEDGCLTFDIWSSHDQPNHFLLYEIYRDKEAFELHLEQAHSKENRPKMKPWLRSQTVKHWNSTV